MQWLHVYAKSMNIKRYCTLAYHHCKVDPQTTLKSPYSVLSEAEFLDEIQSKAFLFAIHKSPLQLCLEIFTSSNSRNLLQFLEFLLYTVKNKGRIVDRKP